MGRKVSELARIIVPYLDSFDNFRYWKDGGAL